MMIMMISVMLPEHTVHVLNANFDEIGGIEPGN